MKVVAHEAISEDLPIGLHTGVVQCVEEHLVIHIVAEDRLAAIASVHDVVNRSRVFDAQLAGHGRDIGKWGWWCK